MPITSDYGGNTGDQYVNPYIVHGLDRSKDQVRLLSILPGQGDEEVKSFCSIANLDDFPPYNALSYRWGDTQDKTDVIVDGVRLKVTINLAAALRRIRLAHEPLIIWADAICINQDDPAEMSHQINLMQRIYTQCEQCLVWMGDIFVKDEAGAAAVKAAQAAFNALRICAREPHDTTIGWPGENPIAVGTNGQAITAGDALQAFMDCAWWQRIWTVQEIVLPSQATALWGSQQISFATIFQAAKQMVNCEWPRPNDLFDLFRAGTPLFPPNSMGTFTIPVLSILHAKDWKNRNINPLYRVWRFRDRKATKPKDKLFGIWALITEGSFPSITANDYNLDVVTLFTRATVDLLRYFGNLQPLIGWRGERVTDGLPSWVLDFVQRDPAQCAGDYYWTHEIAWRTFDAGCRLPRYQFRRETDDQNRSLELKGVQVDQVSCVVADMRCSGSSADDWKANLESVIADHPNREELVVQFDNILQGKLDENHERVSDDGWPGNSWWMDRMLRFQVLFLTEDARIGVGPLNLKRGDRIWIFPGGNHPFLLRPVTREATKWNSWEFIGDCFVFGIMYGEIQAGNCGREMEAAVLL